MQLFFVVCLSTVAAMARPDVSFYVEQDKAISATVACGGDLYAVRYDTETANQCCDGRYFMAGFRLRCKADPLNYGCLYNNLGAIRLIPKREERWTVVNDTATERAWRVP